MCEFSMPFRSVCFALALGTFTAFPALAESHVFIIANQSDGYGIDQCLAHGESCGLPAARAYCHSRDFRRVTAFRRADPNEITGALFGANDAACIGSGCTDYIAITCEK
jgi:hypothetical protein